MIIVGYGHTKMHMEYAALVPWLFGFNHLAPKALKIGEIGIEVNEPLDAVEEYSVSIDNSDFFLPASWVTSWATGLAASHGHNLHDMLDTDLSGRSQRMQALMICHERRWMAYHGVGERKP